VTANRAGASAGIAVVVHGECHLVGSGVLLTLAWASIASETWSMNRLLEISELPVSQRWYRNARAEHRYRVELSGDLVAFLSPLSVSSDAAIGAVRAHDVQACFDQLFPALGPSVFRLLSTPSAGCAAAGLGHVLILSLRRAGRMPV